MNSLGKGGTGDAGEIPPDNGIGPLSQLFERIIVASGGFLAVVDHLQRAVEAGLPKGNLHEREVVLTVVRQQYGLSVILFPLLCAVQTKSDCLGREWIQPRHAHRTIDSRKDQKPLR